jgi:hypothetical protein
MTLLSYSSTHVWESPATIAFAARPESRFRMQFSWNAKFHFTKMIVVAGDLNLFGRMFEFLHLPLSQLNQYELKFTKDKNDSTLLLHPYRTWWCLSLRLKDNRWGRWQRQELMHEGAKEKWWRATGRQLLTDISRLYVIYQCEYLTWTCAQVDSRRNKAWGGAAKSKLPFPAWSPAKYSAVISDSTRMGRSGSQTGGGISCCCKRASGGPVQHF